MGLAVKETLKASVFAALGWKLRDLGGLKPFLAAFQRVAKSLANKPSTDQARLMNRGLGLGLGI